MRPRLLVIDDEILLGQTIQLGLEDSTDVLLEHAGQGGLDRLLAGEAFSLVICDLSLPDLSGVEIYRELARQRPELLSRFAIMTGGAMTDAVQSFLDHYKGLLLEKPFSLSELEALVHGIEKA